MESNYTNYTCVQTVLSIELKFGMHITVHYLIYCVDFGEYWMNSFFTGVQKNNSYTLRPMESNSLKYSNIQTVHSMELKFGMHIIVYYLIYCVDFGEFRINSFFIGR